MTRARVERGQSESACRLGEGAAIASLPRHGYEPRQGRPPWRASPAMPPIGTPYHHLKVGAVAAAQAPRAAAHREPARPAEAPTAEIWAGPSSRRRNASPRAHPAREGQSIPARAARSPKLSYSASSRSAIVETAREIRGVPTASSRDGAPRKLALEIGLPRWATRAPGPMPSSRCAGGRHLRGLLRGSGRAIVGERILGFAQRVTRADPRREPPDELRLQRRPDSAQELRAARPGPRHCKPERVRAMREDCARLQRGHRPGRRDEPARLAGACAFRGWRSGAGLGLVVARAAST